MKQKKTTFPIADFLYEVGVLSKTPRSFSAFLGSGSQSVAEHINRTCYIAYVLAELAGVDSSKVVTMALMHDISEARISDLNYVHQKYTTRDEDGAHRDVVADLPFGDKLKSIIDEYEERESIESILVKDADNLEFIITIKEQADVGNERANDWIPSAVKRLKTKEAKELAKQILSTDSDHWWFGDKDSEWWVSRTKEDKQKMEGSIEKGLLEKRSSKKEKNR